MARDKMMLEKKGISMQGISMRARKFGILLTVMAVLFIIALSNGPDLSRAAETVANASAIQDNSGGIISGPMAQGGMGGWMEMAVKRLESSISRTSMIFANAHKVPSEWSSAFSRMFASGSTPLIESFGDIRLWLFLLAMILSTVWLPLWASRRFRSEPSSPFLSAIKRLLFELIGIAIAFGIAALAAATILTGVEPNNDVRFELLYVIVRWRLTIMLVTVLLRTDEPEIRLLPVDNVSAKQIVRTICYSLAVIFAFTTTIPFFQRWGVSIESAQLVALIAGTLSIAFFIQAQRQLSIAMPGHDGKILLLGGTISLTTWAIWSFSVIFLDFTVYYAFLLAVLAAWLLLAIVRILELAKKPQPGEELSTRLSQPLISAIQRSLVVIATMISVFILGRIWAVEVFGIVMDAEFHKLTRALGGSFIVLVLGYIAYESTKAWAAARFGTDSAVAGPASEDLDELLPRSRLGTVIPLLTGSLLVIFVVIAVLLGLSDLGFNTAPILAGAGIFGLAISFGSQALVRDIVSGIFYMVDDAFRVGEYIETGRLKGTVEKIMLRSLRVRHQNGQFHTIPYGQLGAVTNFSRDWATIKFNLGLSRDSDLEKVRKTAKKCGQKLLEDEDFGQEFILPLKFQGVADINENAIICRFKFTVRPLRPSQVQRESLKRLHQALTENGIEFATHSVKVISSTVSPENEAVLLAAAAKTAYISEKAPLESEFSASSTAKLVLAAENSGRD